jgi:hypothetical protein
MLWTGFESLRPSILLLPPFSETAESPGSAQPGNNMQNPDKISKNTVNVKIVFFIRILLVLFCCFLPD